MRRLRLREAAVGLLLDGVDEVGKLDGVLNEEDRNVVADDVPVAFLGIELHGKAAHIASEVGRALAAGDRREAHEGGRLLARALEDVGAGYVRQRLVGLEIAMSAEAARVDDALRDTLVVEVKNLLAEMKVLKRGRPARADPQRVLVVRDRNALLGGQDRPFAARDLVSFAARGPRDRLISIVDGFLTSVARGRTAVFRFPFHGIASWSIGFAGEGAGLRLRLFAGALSPLQNCPRKSLFLGVTPRPEAWRRIGARIGKGLRLTRSIRII